MFVNIAHAEGDSAIAEELKSYLSSWGLPTHLESGTQGFRPLQKSDVVIGLWSRNSVFSTYRMVMERRLLEAWTDQRLILVKLDHQFLPVGLRDLPSIDGTFESARKTMAWPKVQREAKDAINRALVRSQEPFPKETDPEPSPPGSPEDLTTEEKIETPIFISYARADASTVAPIVDLVKSKGHSIWIDQGNISAGEGWAGEIVRGIRSSAGIMIMCSPRAFESDHIKREVYLADRYQKQMLPTFLEAAEPPDDFEFFFAGVQWLKLFQYSEEEQPEAIARAVSAFR